MKVEILEDRTIQIEEVYVPVIFKSEDGRDGETISICMRDDGFELVYRVDGHGPIHIKCNKGEVTHKTHLR